MKGKIVKEIFRERPVKWGTKGDPGLWEEMRRHFEAMPEPATTKEFARLFMEAFRHFTGEEIASGKFIYVKKYDKGGLSKGQVCADFWMNNALPMLKKRFEALIK
jgi:hypothetical protein